MATAPTSSRPAAPPPSSRPTSTTASAAASAVPATTLATALGLPVLAGVGALLVGMLVTGAAAATLVDDPGALTRWALPAVRTISDLAAALTIGLLVLVAYALPARGSRAAREAGARQGAVSSPMDGVALVATRYASVSGTVWAVASAVVVVLSYSRLSGATVTSPGFLAQLGHFVTEIGVLRALLISTALAAVVAVGAATTTRETTAGWMALLSLLALMPLALTGHAAGTKGHEPAVDSLAMHLVGVTVWLGGLAALVLVRRQTGPGTADVVSRYSSLAAACFALVAVSGVVNAGLRLGGWGNLATAYGGLLVVKAVLLLALGAAGWRHRSALIAGLRDGRAGNSARPFWRLVTAELALMGLATGLGVALSASAPPQPSVPDAAASVAEQVTGYPLPGPISGWQWLTDVRPDLLWLTVVAVLGGSYLLGVRRLAQRGDRWSVLRTVSWLLGLVILTWVTSGAPGIYGRVLFSAHMLGHMTLSMVVPPLLVLGAPVSLAMRAMTARRDGSRGPREWLLAVVHSRFLTLLSNPIVAAGIFAGSLIAFYYSPLFELALRTHTGHVLMTVHFLLAGYLFSSVLIGIDPGPARPVYPLRLLVLFATMAFHAFFGVALLQGSRLLAADFFTSLDRPWGRSLLVDQQLGGSIAWGIGELPTVILGMGVAWAWVKSDDRESRRSDRAADRDGDAELVAYNARLASLASRGERSG